MDKQVDIAGTALTYKLVLPKGYAPARTFPCVLAFPPGAQGPGIAERVLERVYRAEAERRGYLIVMPVTPDGTLFFNSASRVFPAFFDYILAEYNVAHGKLHLAGMSNGGISAFHVAAAHPRYVLSVTAFPGYLPEEERAGALRGAPIHLHVGECDPEWRSLMADQAMIFRHEGLSVRYMVEPGEGHVIENLSGPGAARLFDQFDEATKNV